MVLATEDLKVWYDKGGNTHWSFPSQIQGNTDTNNIKSEGKLQDNHTDHDMAQNMDAKNSASNNNHISSPNPTPNPDPNPNLNPNNKEDKLTRTVTYLLYLNRILSSWVSNFIILFKFLSKLIIRKKV